MIGGLVPCSFIDYPGLLAAVVFTRGCNLRCPYCHNRGLVDGSTPATAKPDEVLRFLARRRGLIDAVVVSGGEPTLQPGLASFVGSIRHLGFRVKLDTNGTRPQVLESLLRRGALDYVALDVKDPWDEYAALGASADDAASAAESLRVLLASGVDHEVRTTVVLPRHDEARLDRMATQVRGALRWVLQPFRPGECLDPTPGRSSPRRSELAGLAASLGERHGLRCVVRGERDCPRASRPSSEAVPPV